MVTKPAKEFTDASGRRKIKGNMDIELCVDALEMSQFYDHLVLFSGDGDFTALVAALQRKGKRVTVVSTLTTQTPMIADDLRRQADFFLDVADLAKTVGRVPPIDRTVDRNPDRTAERAAHTAERVVVDRTPATVDKS